MTSMERNIKTWNEPKILNEQISQLETNSTYVRPLHNPPLFALKLDFLWKTLRTTFETQGPMN
jgi:hypothetical protein